MAKSDPRVPAKMSKLKVVSAFAAFVGVLFLFPATGIGAGLWLMHGLEKTEAAAGRPPLETLCWHLPFQWQSTDLCGEYQHAALLFDSSLASGLYLVAASALIALAGAAARRSENFLVAAFGPIARVLVATVSLVILVQGACLAYAAFALIEEPTFELMVPIGFASAAIAAAFGLLSTGLAAFRLEPLRRRAVELTPEAQPALWRAVAQIARGIDAPMPDHILAGLDESFFAAFAPVELPDGRILNGEKLYLSLPLMRVLSIEEMGAIIGHELAHFKSNDTRWTLRFGPVYVGLQDTLDHFDDERNWGQLASLPAQWLLMLFMGQFATAERLHHRRREFEADRAGAQAAGASAVASGLVRITATHGVSRAFRNALAERKLDAGQSENLARFFAYWADDHLSKQDPQALLVKLAAARLPHPVDTHPPLRDRLAALGVDPDRAWLTLPADSASAMIDGVDEIERRLSRGEIAHFAEIANMRIDREPALRREAATMK